MTENVSISQETIKLEKINKSNHHFNLPYDKPVYSVSNSETQCLCSRDEITDIINLKSPVINLAQKQVKIFLEESLEDVSFFPKRRCSGIRIPYSKRSVIFGCGFGSLILLTIGAYIGGAVCNKYIGQSPCTPIFILLLNSLFPSFQDSDDSELNTYF